MTKCPSTPPEKDRMEEIMETFAGGCKDRAGYETKEVEKEEVEWIK